MRPLRNAGWILFGVLLGAAASLVIGRPPTVLAPVDAVSLASLTVFAMLVASLKEPWSPLVVPR